MTSWLAPGTTTIEFSPLPSTTISARPVGDVLIVDRRGVDPVAGEHGMHPAPGVVVAEAAHEGDAGAAAGGRHRLVEALAAGVLGVAVAEHRLTGPGMRGVVATRSRLALPTTQTSQRAGMQRRQLAERARTPIGAIRRKPAACRSSSLSPPQNPYSCWPRAKSRHVARTVQLAHTSRAVASRRSRA